MSGRVYVGNLEPSVPKEELQDVCSKYGRLADVWVARNPPGFAFVTFEDPRDAEDCVRGMADFRLGGQHVKCEIARSKGGNPPRGGYSGDRGGGGYDRGDRGSYGDRGGTGYDDRDRARGGYDDRNRDDRRGRDDRDDRRARDDRDDRPARKRYEDDDEPPHRRHNDSDDDDRRDRRRGDRDRRRRDDDDN